MARIECPIADMETSHVRDTHGITVCLFALQVAQKRAEWQPGTYIRAYGHLMRKQQGGISLNGFNVRTVTDFNEVRALKCGAMEAGVMEPLACAQQLIALWTSICCIKEPPGKCRRCS